MKNRLRELREDKGITQLNLAVRIGTSQQTISKIEQYLVTPRADLAIKLAGFFNVSLEYLLYLSDEKYSNDTFKRFNKVCDKYSEFIYDFSYLEETDRIIVQVLVKEMLRQRCREEKDFKDTEFGSKQA